MVVRRGGEKGNILLCTIDGVKKKEGEILVTRGKYDKREYIYIYICIWVGIKGTGIVLAVIRQPVRVLQLLGRQFGSQQTRATSSRHDGYKLCRWPIYIAAILANSTRSWQRYLLTYVREKGPPRAFIEKHSADTSVSKSGLTGSRRRRILKRRVAERLAVWSGFNGEERERRNSVNKDRETGSLAFDRRNSSNPREKEKNFWRDADR